MSGPLPISEIRVPVTEGPGFLTHVFMEREDDGSVCLGVYNRRGDTYAYSRLSLKHFLALVSAITADQEGEITDDDDALRRDCD